MLGIAITTTPNRQVLSGTLERWRKHTPPQARILVFNDEEYRGVAFSKNMCLKLLEAMGVTEFILSDDDTYPLKKDYWKPLVESKEPHLLHNFKLPSKPASDMVELYRDENIVSYSHTRGCMIYLNKIVLDTVGGFDTRFNNSYEHPEYTRRIHNAGLTTHRSMSLPNTNELFYCLDQDSKIESSIKKDKVRDLKNWKLYRQTKDSKEYMEFR